VEPPTDPVVEPAGGAPTSSREPRQRWRLTFARRVSVGEPAAIGRAYTTLWEAALLASGLPVVIVDSGRPRFSLAAQLPAGAAGRAELADAWLTERWPAWRVREALEGVLPPDHELVGCEDTWLGAPALPGRVAAADYLIELREPLDRAQAEVAARRLLAAASLPRVRTKGTSTKTYDLRPLLLAIDVEPSSSGGRVRVRTRLHPELGSGRPDEVIAALGEELGVTLTPMAIARERLVLIEDLEERKPG
jgi:radical SAM-linked protein